MIYQKHLSQDKILLQHLCLLRHLPPDLGGLGSWSRHGVTKEGGHSPDWKWEVGGGCRAGVWGMCCVPPPFLGWRLLCPQEACGSPDSLQGISLDTLSKDLTPLMQRRCRKPRAGCSLLGKHWNQTWGPQTPGRTLPGGLALRRPPTALGSQGTGPAAVRTDAQTQSHTDRRHSPEERDRC